MDTQNTSSTSTQTVLVIPDDDTGMIHPANRLRVEMGDLHQDDLVFWKRLDGSLFRVTFVQWPWPNCSEPVEAYLRRA